METIDVSYGEINEIDIKLVSSCGLLVINTEPPNTDIKIRGENQSFRSPLVDHPLEQGTHQVIVSSDGYKDWNGNV